ncbi:MAG: VOC family protein [Devosia sp.]
MTYKPEGYTALSPYIIVEDAGPTLAFIKAVFGVDPLMVHRISAGRIGQCEIRIDDTIVMLGEAPGAGAIHLHVYVPDLDACFSRALAAGGTEVQPLSDKGDGDRRGGVRDPSGTTWWLAETVGHR